MPTFETEDHCSIYYEIHALEDNKPAVLFLNGITQTTLNWLPLAKELSNQYTVILYDARGQGKSTLGQSELSIDIHVEDLLQLLTHLKIERMHLVGLSHGAQVACAFTAYYAHRVRKLVLCSLGAEKDRFTRAAITAWQKALDSGGVKAMAWAALPVVFGRQYIESHHGWLEKIVAAITSRNRKAYLSAHLHAMQNYPAPSEYATRIRNKCLVLSGTEDPLVTEENANRLADLCSGRHIQLIETGHSIPAESPEDFKSAVLEFLQE